MNANLRQPDVGNLPPMSAGDHDLTQTMLQSGMLRPPEQPGPLGAVDRFQIIRPLGAGGMGQILLAEEPITGARVALKMIRPELVGETWAVRRFLTEAQHMYRMAHPNILKVMEVSDRAAGPYYVMPFIDGGSLADRIKPGQPLARDEIIAIVGPVAEALAYAHARGIIHRDLKPANILLDREGRPYLTDFGLLRTVFNDSMVDVRKPLVEGTVAYLSPGTATGKAEDTRCDIYAFGAMLYELLTGRPPYSGPDPEAILRQIVAGPPDPIRKLNPKAPADLAQIAEWAMARELRDRYAEMTDIVNDLERAAQGREPLGPHGRARAPARALAVAGILIGTLAAIGGLLVGVAAWRAARPGGNGAMLAERGWQRWRAQDFRGAENWFAQATRADPANADAWNGLGWAQFNQGLTLNAKASFERCLAARPNHPAALNGLGWIARGAGETNAALQYWEQAVKADPATTAALSGLVATYLELGQYRLAAQYAEAWLKVEPASAEARRALERARRAR